MPHNLHVFWYNCTVFHPNSRRPRPFDRSSAIIRSQTKTLRRSMNHQTFPEQRVCPKCDRHLPLSSFKLRSISEGSRPSWCQSCVNQQARSAYARRKKRAINEQFRRLRATSPPRKVAATFADAARIAGGPVRLGKRLRMMLECPDSFEVFRAARVLCIVMKAVANEG